MISFFRARSQRAFVPLFLATGLVPLVLLAYLSIHIAEGIVRSRVERSLSSSAALTARYISAELEGLSQVDDAFATRPLLVRALAGGDPRRYDRKTIRETLEQLARVRPGIGTAFIADWDGRLINIVPATPLIVGKDFSFRDWYRGVRRTGAPYVSEAYRSQAAGQPFVVGVAAPVRAPSGKPIAILVTGYELSAIERFAGEFEQSQGVALQLTDQRGVVIAESSGARSLAPVRDSRVKAALAGRAGVTEAGEGDDRMLSAYAPLPRLGWTLVAELPSREAFAQLHSLRFKVLFVCALLAALLAFAGVMLARLLRQRQRIDDERRAVLDATADGILMSDCDGRLRMWNEASERLLPESTRAPHESLVEIARADAAAMRDPEGYVAMVESALADPQLEGMDEFELVGTGQTFSRFTAPVRDTAGRTIGRIFVIRDTTAERQAERLKSDLVATVSHELRTPLTGILGFAELAQNRDLDADKRETYLAAVHREAKRLSALINDFLDIQRMEAGGFTVSLEPLDLVEVVREQAALLEPHPVTVEVEPDAPLDVAGDRDRLAQVLANLLSNAVKYSPDGGEVHVTVERRNGSARVAVSDRGLGIPADQQAQIFTKFFRVDSSDTRRIGGTGLGLALCREIVEAHAGQIGFESRHGEGSTFWFELPAATNGSSRPSRRALLVEADPSSAAFLAECLTLEGYEVEVVRTGEEALERAAEHPPTVICLDIFLVGDLDGFDVLARLKANAATASVPVIVCTGHNGREHASALGAADVLTKPLDAKRLRDVVARVVSAKASILIVDDDATVRALVSETLAEAYELRQAGDGAEALERIAERPPDAVILDLMMPELDGFAVLERLQSDPETRLIPVVVLTARQLSPTERTMLRSRAVAVVGKVDYSVEELRRLIRGAVDA